MSHEHTFITPFGRYCFFWGLFGITSASEYFQRQMSRILEGQDNIRNLIDDVLFFGKTRSDHDYCLQAALDGVGKAEVKLNRAKY